MYIGDDNVLIVPRLAKKATPKMKHEAFCSKCRETKSVGDFYSCKHRSTGISAYCKTCLKSYYKKYNTERRDEVNARNLQYAKLNPQKYREYSSKRRAKKRDATPPWITGDIRSQMKDIFWLADDLRKTTGEPYHVDHIIPLNNEYVCGLHVPWNLQIIPADMNISKSNGFDCWWID